MASLLGYGKSDILSRVERSVKCCVRYHSDKFTKSAIRREAIQAKLNLEKTAVATIPMEELTLLIPREIFNDGTGAGILNQLDSCTRALLLHEADTTMGSWNVLQSSPLDRSPGRIDPFRSTLMTLYEDPGGFTRLLKNEQINTEGSKLILLVSE
jgi:hypothetical protein